MKNLLITIYTNEERAKQVSRFSNGIGVELSIELNEDTGLMKVKSLRFNAHDVAISCAIGCNNNDGRKLLDQYRDLNKRLYKFELEKVETELEMPEDVVKAVSALELVSTLTSYGEGSVKRSFNNAREKVEENLRHLLCSRLGFTRFTTPTLFEAFIADVETSVSNWMDEVNEDYKKFISEQEFVKIEQEKAKKEKHQHLIKQAIKLGIDETLAESLDVDILSKQITRVVCNKFYKSNPDAESVEVFFNGTEMIAYEDNY